MISRFSVTKILPFMKIGMAVGEAKWREEHVLFKIVFWSRQGVSALGVPGDVLEVFDASGLDISKFLILFQ